MAASQYLATSIVNWIRGVAMPSAPSVLYLALFTAGGAELSGDGYARIAIDPDDWATISEGGGFVTTENDAVITSDEATDDWLEVTQFRLYDSPTGGNALTGLTALDEAQTVLS